jgi:hypothetical protein
VTVLPDDDPENVLGFGLLPVTEMVKSEGFLVPPLVFSTFVLTTNVPKIGVYRLVTVQLIGTPPLAVPEHPEEYAVVYPEIDVSETLYVPACKVTEVPEDEPANETGFGLFPETVIVKSEAFFVPPLVLSTLVTTFKNVVDPGGGVYLLATVQLTRPPLAVPEHPEEYVEA